MDVLFFLKDRTRLIRQYYELAALPFAEIMSKIEAEKEPYVPPYSEDGEPPLSANGSMRVSYWKLRDAAVSQCYRLRCSSTSRLGSGSSG